MTQVGEKIAPRSGMQPRPLLKEQVTGKVQVVLLAPVTNFLIVCFLVLLGQRAPEIVAYLLGIASKIIEQLGSWRMRL